MSTSNHPDQAWFVSYAAGSLTPSFNLLLQAHLAVCSQCRCGLKKADEIGAQFMFGGEEAPMDNFEMPNPQLGVNQNESIEWGKDEVTDLSQFFDHYIGTHLDGLQWMNAGKGLQLCKLSDSDDDKMLMLRAAPGTVLPKHRHNGSELTLVLKGAYFCEDALFKVGDIEDADDTTLHQPVVTNDSECICVAAVDGPLRFSGLLQRVAQPFLGI
ncbi:MAG TPA: hypothetical protein DCM54_17235 [Gammaproteobacteria bacterium]|nr:hypothetical protein [Gammaproteobacteria bacterium]|tara:strand:+ start:587 stop:1225 length:639 start_codon:yes stop_codon:yes gene_type:complete